MKTKELVSEYGQPDSQQYELQDAGAVIREYRSISGLTQSQLGDMVGLGKAQISRIESRENLTVGTVNRLLEAMGAKAYISVESSEEDCEAYVYEAVEIISMFAAANGIPLSKAHSYLELFGGLAFLKKYFILEQSYSIEETVEHLKLICRQKGGQL